MADLIRPASSCKILHLYSYEIAEFNLNTLYTAKMKLLILPHQVELEKVLKKYISQYFTKNRKRIRQILIVVQAGNKKYDKSPTFSITVDVPERNLQTICHGYLLLKNHDTFLI